MWWMWGHTQPQDRQLPHVLKTGLEMTLYLKKRHGFSPGHLFLMCNKLTGAITQGLTADLLVTATQINRHQAVRTCTVSILLKMLNAPPTSACKVSHRLKSLIPPIQLFAVVLLKGGRETFPQRWVVGNTQNQGGFRMLISRSPSAFIP